MLSEYDNCLESIHSALVMLDAERVVANCRPVRLPVQFSGLADTDSVIDESISEIQCKRLQFNGKNFSPAMYSQMTTLV